MHGDTIVNNRTFTSYITFSGDVTNLRADDFIVDNGEFVSVAGGGRYYTITLNAFAPGNVDITLVSNAVSSSSSGLSNAQSATRTVSSNGSFSDFWLVDTQADWVASAQSTNMDINNGNVQSSADQASYSSVVRSFASKRRAVAFTLSQSPDWNNWQPVGNVGPREAGDAQVLVSRGDQDYYLLGLGSSGGYHAWHSTNMHVVAVFNRSMCYGRIARAITVKMILNGFYCPACLRLGISRHAMFYCLISTYGNCGY